MLHITLYFINRSVTIYFAKGGGIKLAKSYATRVAKLLKYKVTDIYIRYENENKSILDGAGLYTLANKRGHQWVDYPEYSEYRKKLKIKP